MIPRSGSTSRPCACKAYALRSKRQRWYPRWQNRERVGDGFVRSIVVCTRVHVKATDNMIANIFEPHLSIWSVPRCSATLSVCALAATGSAWHFAPHGYGLTQSWASDLTVICRNSVIARIVYKAFVYDVASLPFAHLENHEHGVTCRIADGFDPRTFWL